MLKVRVTHLGAIFADGMFDAETAHTLVDSLCRTYGEEDGETPSLHMDDFKDMQPGESYSSHTGYLEYIIEKPELPDLNQTLQPFRDAGYMIIAFDKDELKGVSPRGIQEHFTSEISEHIELNAEDEEIDAGW